MANVGSGNAQAGWYPDPGGSARTRWWDGAQWTEHYRDPYSTQTVAAELKAPDGAVTNTPWIWLVIFLPMLPLFPMLFIDWSSMFHFDPDDAYSVISSQLGVFTSPFYLIAVLGGWLTYGLCVWFAYLDWKHLGAVGVPRPFHWAFTFLGSVIYAIGRSVVVRKRTGHGSAPMWAAIGTIVLMFVYVIYLTVIIMTAAFSSIDGVSGLN
jgi:hypothetical protein